MHCVPHSAKQMMSRMSGFKKRVIWRATAVATALIHVYLATAVATAVIHVYLATSVAAAFLHGGAVRID